MQTGQTIINDFETQVDDATELSTTAQLMVLNRVYRKILSERDWRFLRKEFTGPVVDKEVELPEDFDQIMNNKESEAIAYVGVNRQPYKIIAMADRHDYHAPQRVCFVDYTNLKLVFLEQPIDPVITFDYKYLPPDIEMETSPVIPERFKDIFVYGMAAEDYVIQQTQKSKSYAAENMQLFGLILTNLKSWDLKPL
jgi:hypothetical protein